MEGVQVYQNKLALAVACTDYVRTVDNKDTVVYHRKIWLFSFGRTLTVRKALQEPEQKQTVSLHLSLSWTVVYSYSSTVFRAQKDTVNCSIF